MPDEQETGLGLVSNEPFALRASRKYLNALHRVRYPLLMSWLIITVVFGIFAGRFPSNVTDEIGPPDTSQAYSAAAVWRAQVPVMQQTEGIMVFSRGINKPFNFAQDPRYQMFDLELMYWLYTHTYMVVPPSSALNATWVVAAYSSYFVVQAVGLPLWSANTFMAPGNYSAYSIVSYNKTYTGPGGCSAAEFSQQLKDAIAVILKKYGLQTLIRVTPLGMSPFLSEITQSTVHDMKIVFGLFMPLALIVFSVSIGSVRILVLPFTSIIATACMAFGLMDFVASSMAVNTTAPGIAGVLCLALCMSFSYTFAAKFQRETLDQLVFGEGRSLVVLELVLAYSGRTIFVSGVTIALCSLGILFFPIEMLRSIGITTLVASLTSTLVALNLVPVILTCWPDFFERGMGDWVWPRIGGNTDGLLIRRKRQPAHHAGEPADVTTTPTKPAQNASTGPHHGDEPSVLFLHPAQRGAAPGTRESAVTFTSQQVAQERYFYRYFVAFLCQWQIAVPCVILCVGLSMYPITQAGNTNYSNDVSQFMPRNSASLPEFRIMSQTFRAGEVFQYDIVLKFNAFEAAIKENDHPYTLLFTPDVYTAGQSFIQELVNTVPNTPPEAFDAFFYAGLRKSNPNISIAEYGMCMQNPKTSDCSYLGVIGALFVNGVNGPYTWVQVRLSINPLSPEGRTWYENMKSVAPGIGAKYGMSVWITGYAAGSIDTVDFANDKFPIVVIIILAILAISIAAMTWSIGIPARALATVAITWATTAGLANLTFCKGALDWLPIDGLQSEGDAIAWLVPFATLMLVTGLSLHYDLSLVLRVQQFHHHGFETCSAIVLSAQEAGTEINVGAGINILLFSGLLLSEIPVMNQLAFYLVLVAFLQGVVYRLFLSTTFMAVLGEWNWFPLNLTSKADEVAEDPLVGTEAHAAGDARPSHARHSLMPADTPRRPSAAAQPLTSHDYGTM